MIVWLPLLASLMIVVNGYVIEKMISTLELMTASCFFILGLMLLFEQRGWYSQTSSRTGYAIFLLGCVGGIMVFISDTLQATDQQVNEITFYMEEDPAFGAVVAKRFVKAGDISMLDAFRLILEIESTPLNKGSATRFAMVREKIVNEWQGSHASN